MDDSRKYGWSLPGCRICSHTVHRRQTHNLVSRQDKLWIPHYNGRRPALTDLNSDCTVFQNYTLLSVHYHVLEEIVVNKRGQVIKQYHVFKKYDPSSRNTYAKEEQQKTGKYKLRF